MVKKVFDYLEGEAFDNFMGRWVKSIKGQLYPRERCCIKCRGVSFMPGDRGDGMMLMYYCCKYRTVLNSLDQEGCTLYERVEDW